MEEEEECDDDSSGKSQSVLLYTIYGHIVESEKERKEDVSRVTIFAKRKRTCYLVEFISI